MKLFLNICIIFICIIIVLGGIIYFERSVNKIDEKLERIKQNGRGNN